MAFVRRSTRPILILLMVVCCSVTAGAMLRPTLAVYTAHLEELQSLLANCRANATACDPKQVGSDEEVQLPGLNAGANVNFFAANYDWLRQTLQQARNPKLKDRDEQMASAINRVQQALEEAKAATVPGGAPGQFAHARASTNAILAHPEFITVTGQSIWDRILARIFLWLDSLFGNVAKFGQKSPWIGPLLEWSLIALALIGLSVWAMRVLQRQRLKIRMEVARQTEPWEEASRNWRELAAEQAARKNWREAIHCLYWASIVMLEGRRLWTPNRSRTPREYLRLLEAGSPRWTLLRQQTQDFERIWYGLYAAEPGDYHAALQLHEQLRAA